MAVTRGTTVNVDWTPNESASTASLTCTLPSAMAAGKLLVAHVVGSTSSLGLPGTGGWQWAAGTPLGTNNAVLGGLAWTTDPAAGLAFTQATAGRMTVVLTVYSGADSVTVMDVTPTTGNVTTQSMTLTGITTVTAGDMLVSGCGINASTITTITQPSGWTLVARNTSGTGKGGAYADFSQTSQGATGNEVWTNDATAGLQQVGYLAAIRAAVSAVATTSPVVSTPGMPGQRQRGSAVILSSQAVSLDAQPPARVVGAPPGVPGQRGSAVVLSSRAPSGDFQQPAHVVGVAVRPPATGSAQILASRADPPTPTDTPSPALASSPLRAPRPAGTAVVLASQAPSADAQPEPLVVVAGRWPVLPGSAAVSWSRADPVVQTDSQPRPLVAIPLRPAGPGSSLIVSSVSPSLDAQPAPVLVRAGTLPIRRGSALLVNSLAQPLPPTLTPVAVTSFTIPRPRPAAGVLLLRMASDFAVCTTSRPSTGTTTRPNTGTTAYALATTARPNSC